MLRILCAVFALFTAVCHASNPVIGVLTQADRPYIAASYVKYLESAGARVVPILHISSIDDITAMFKKLNGFFIPGGGANLASERDHAVCPRVMQIDFSDPFMVAAGHMVSLARQANANGDYFPVWV